MSEIAMPRLSDSMEEGTILKWLKADGDEVKRGEELVEIETDKANMNYESDQDGVLTIVAKEGDTLAVGEPIAQVGGSGERAATKKETSGEDGNAPKKQTTEGAQQTDAKAEPEREAEPKPDAEIKRSKPATAASQVATPPDETDRVKASPVAKRMAQERGLSLSQIRGSGPGGRIVKADIEAAAKESAGETQAAPGPAVKTPATAQTAPSASHAVAAQAAQTTAQAAAPLGAEKAAEKRPVPPPVTAGEGEGATIKGNVEIVELTKLQATVARRMAESKATAPEFVLNIDVDMERAIKLRNETKETMPKGQTAPSFNDFIVKAAALALREFPRANGAYRDGKWELYSRINVGIAVAAHDALVVPTVFDADRKSLGEISRETRALAERVRAGAITPPELAGGTFTVSNLGMFGITNFTAVINPPQAAILAVGALTPKPVAYKDKVKVRHIMQLTLCCDHRILYGADGAQFLVRIKELLENPVLMAL